MKSEKAKKLTAIVCAILLSCTGIAVSVMAEEMDGWVSPGLQENSISWEILESMGKSSKNYDPDGDVQRIDTTVALYEYSHPNHN